MNDWIPTAERLPDEGRGVMTKLDDDKGERNVQLMFRRGRLWFIGEMYVYYTPTHWKPLTT